MCKCNNYICNFTDTLPIAAVLDETDDAKMKDLVKINLN